MIFNAPVKVGILVCLAIILFIVVYMFLNADMSDFYSVYVNFDDAIGMTEGSPVRMSGVTIGSIKKIKLSDDYRASIELMINNKFTIPKDSTFILRVGMLIGEKTIDVIPNKKTRIVVKPDSVLEGTNTTRLEDLIPKFDKILSSLSNQSTNILAQTDMLLKNLIQTTNQINNIVGNKKMFAHIDKTLNNIELASVTLELALKDFHGIVLTNDDKINSILDNTLKVSESFVTAAESIEDFIGSDDIQNSLSDTLGSAKTASDSLSRSMVSLERSLVSLENLVTSEKIQSDIKETVAGSRTAVNEANKVLEKVNRFLDANKDIGSVLKPKLPKTNTNIDSMYDPNTGSFRTSLLTSIEYKDKRFMDIGLYDIGAGNKLILQGVKKISDKEYLRAGLYASKLGIGIDRDINKKINGSLDLYDGEDSKLDLKLKYHINNDWDLLFGADRLFDDNQFLFGLRIKK